MDKRDYSTENRHPALSYLRRHLTCATSSSMRKGRARAKKDAKRNGQAERASCCASPDSGTGATVSSDRRSALPPITIRGLVGYSSAGWFRVLVGLQRATLPSLPAGCSGVLAKRGLLRQVKRKRPARMESVLVHDPSPPKKHLWEVLEKHKNAPACGRRGSARRATGTGPVR